MDDTTILARASYGDPVSIGEGFPGERLRVLAPDALQAARTSAITRALVVTDAGWFPQARRHGRHRRSGTSATIVIACTAGRGWCTSGEHALTVHPGQALAIPANTPHSYGSVDTEPWTIFWMHAEGPLARTFDSDLPVPGPVVIDLHDPTRTQQLLEDVLVTVEVDDTPTTLMRAGGAAWNVLAALAADAYAGPPARRAPVRAVLEHLRLHYDQPVVISELAALAGVSPSHFSALFRSATGGGAVDYAKRLRVARASELLITTDISVAEVGQRVGYDDPQYFSRQFRAVRGCSPTQFRAREESFPSRPEGM